MFFVRIITVVHFKFSTVKLKQIFTREEDAHVKTNNTKLLQLNILSCNKLLNLNNLHYPSSSFSLSYAVSSLNSMYKSLPLSFDSKISKSRVSGMDDKVSTCVDKVFSKLDHCLSSQFI